MAAETQTEASAAAEARWRAMVDATCDDLCVLRRWWPDQTRAEVTEARARLRQRDEPGGEAEAALLALYDAYGGSAAVPEAVRQRLEAYVEERLGRPPWPPRDLADDLPAPAVTPRRRRKTTDGR